MSRRQARETALQSLYQIEVGGADPEAVVIFMAKRNSLLPKDFEFMKDLVYGTKKYEAQIDSIIASLSKDWDIGRLARVDHNIMRMAIYEIKWREDIPYNVSVNEAVELAKIFGGEDSGRFVNGILAKVSKKESEPEDKKIENEMAEGRAL
jgi:N utilization substance protein B